MVAHISKDEKLKHGDRMHVGGHTNVHTVACYFNPNSIFVKETTSGRMKDVCYKDLVKSIKNMEAKEGFRIIDSITKRSKRTSQKNGYMVHFSILGGGVISGDHFPDKHGGENLISDIDEAWNIAKLFAVIDSDYRPVAGYRNKIIRKRTYVPS